MSIFRYRGSREADRTDDPVKRVDGDPGGTVPEKPDAMSTRDDGAGAQDSPTSTEPATDVPADDTPEPAASHVSDPTDATDTAGTADTTDTTDEVGTTDTTDTTGTTGTTGTTAKQAATSHGSPGEPERLVPRDRADAYTARWESVKSGFVDEPRQAVGQADVLVGELLDELQALFADQRRRLEEGLDSDTTSTEDLRMALRRYRSFFDRLVSF